MPFHLTKWYLDAISPQGEAFVGYWARLRWQSLRLHYASSLIVLTDDAPQQQHTLRFPQAPHFHSGRCSWRCGRLRIDGRWHSASHSLRTVSLKTAAGNLNWSCLQPRARAVVRLPNGSTIDGVGYAERLDLRLAPWQLPFDTLYWGHYVSDAHAVVWMDTRDSRTRVRRRIANIDGQTTRDARISADGVELPSVSASLRHGKTRPLREGYLLRTVLEPIPVLSRLLPQSFRRAHEAKRLSASTLLLSDGTADEGFSIHEKVTW